MPGNGNKGVLYNVAWFGKLAEVDVFWLGNSMKFVLVLLLVLVVISLFAGLFFMYRNKGNPSNMVNALKVRVALSILAFLIVIGGFVFGWFPRV